jgi:PilZ domain-containing protein
MEKRRQRRTELAYPCWLIVGDGPPIRACLKDATAAGARIVIPPNTVLPDRFTLALTANLNVQRLCHVAWSDDNEAGLTFVSADDKITAVRKIVF